MSLCDRPTGITPARLLPWMSSRTGRSGAGRPAGERNNRGFRWPSYPQYADELACERVKARRAQRRRSGREPASPPGACSDGRAGGHGGPRWWRGAASRQSSGDCEQRGKPCSTGRGTSRSGPRSSLALACRERPFTGRVGDEEVVTRTVVVYTTEWTEVPGHEGSPWLSCDHPGTPQGRTGRSVLRDEPDCPVRMEGTDYQLPHAFRERDLVAGEDGGRRYTCPVCGLTWRHRADAPAEDPQGSLF